MTTRQNPKEKTQFFAKEELLKNKGKVQPSQEAKIPINLPPKSKAFPDGTEDILKNKQSQYYSRVAERGRSSRVPEC